MLLDRRSVHPDGLKDIRDCPMVRARLAGVTVADITSVLCQAVGLALRW